MALNKLSQTNTLLPEGYTMRAARLDDAEAISTLREAVAVAMGHPNQVNPDDLRARWSQPTFSLTESSRVIVSPEEQIVGSVTIWDTQNPPVYPNVDWWVHPEHEKHGLSMFLLQWTEQRARQVIDRCPAETRVAFRCGTIPGYAPREQAYAALHMTPIRSFYHMLIEMDEAPPVPQFPAGISLHTYKHPADLDRMVYVSIEAFRDHWGEVPQPFAHVRNYWQHRIEEDKLFDETLWFLAIDDATGEIAGTCLCRREDWEDPNAGYVNELGVLPAYRQRGLGLAFLHHTFGEFWKHGQPRVALGVDGSSLTGAVRLYEKAGMHINRQWDMYEKELRSGVEISTTSVE